MGSIAHVELCNMSVPQSADSLHCTTLFLNKTTESLNQMLRGRARASKAKPGTILLRRNLAMPKETFSIISIYGVGRNATSNYRGEPMMLFDILQHTAQILPKRMIWTDLLIVALLRNWYRLLQTRTDFIEG
jgi:hypothetical protein